MAWQPGEPVTRREVWRGRPWMATSVIVVADEPGLLATYLPAGARFTFAQAHPLGPHPWSGRGAWHGHGVLMLQRPGESYAVWVFWEGETRELARWYVNIQEPFRRTESGYDTQDLELDVVVSPDGSWTFKDEDLLEQRVASGRFTPAEEHAIRATGAEIARMLDAGAAWWDDAWADWQPDASWATPPPPALQTLC